MNDAYGTCLVVTHSFITSTGTFIHDLAGYLPGVGTAVRAESVTELFGWFDSGYQEQVELSSDVS